MRWNFWIDVGGTFTDCVAASPQGEMHTAKVLSTGITKGAAGEILNRRQFVDPGRRGDPPGFWTGSRLYWLDPAGRRFATTTVTEFDSLSGRLNVADDLPASLLESAVEAGSPQAAVLEYELDPGEDAPRLAIRRIVGTPPGRPLPPCDVRLGTTRGTNALLERKGARTALITTRGFADALRIGDQSRPRLFDLVIHKPLPLFEDVAEVAERISASGEVLLPLDADDALRQLTRLREAGIESLAICLLHAWCNPAHERRLAELARTVGFSEVSLSSQVAPRIKYVPRGETTALDAYLNPVLRMYLQRLHASLGRGCRLQLMTSTGGLSSPENFTGKDSLLSGPAGGVIGYARVAEQAGFTRAIGFDMGGTSTDVSRYDGRYELEFESTKAGVRVAAPLLAIETVAAGGGSLCGFDGVQLFVGPASAGADPGPACYGRGGPLTITDINLALGRLLPEQFPFRLDGEVVWQRLSALCDEISASPLGRRYAPRELAEGFVALANATMARAIRRISVARGYDPKQYVLVTFGGAGGQHACALAQALQMPAVLVHPWAGVLSAYGLGLADVRRHGELPVLRPCSAETLADLEPAIQQLEHELSAAVRAEAPEETRIDPPVRSLDLRYRGVESSINVVQPTDGDYAAAYAAQHEQLYGYRRQRDIEIVAARVEVVGRSPDPPPLTLPPATSPLQPVRQVEIYFAGAPHAANVYERSDLRAGHQLPGPAILCEPTSTLVIDPGWAGEVAAGGEVILRREATVHQAAEQTPTGSPAVADAAPDPVVLELFHNRFASIAEQMGVTLQRTAVSTNVKERLDFSCAIFDAEGQLVVNAPHIPVHLGAMSETVRTVLRDNPGLKPGDVIVTNDPYRGGSHLPDVTVVTPVHEESTGRLLFVTASRAHHAEIGGIVPGSMPPFSRRLAEEGVLLRDFQLVSGGTSHEEDLRRVLLEAPYPTRKVDDNLADIAAQTAANRLGARLLLELVQSEGAAAVLNCMRQIQQAAAAKMRRAIARLGDGVFERTDYLDDGAPIAVRITINGERAAVDFTGTGAVLPNNLNANRAIVTAAVLYVFRCLIDEDIPLNGGVLEPVEMILPECLLNPPPADDPRDCPAIVGGNVETSQRVVDVLLGSLHMAAASQGTMNNLSFGDASFGYYETICGGSGATPVGPGADAVHTHMTNTRLTDVELLEHRYPVRVREFAIRRGSGGRGRQRGGDGVVRRLEFLRPLEVSMLSQRRGRFAPFGLQGGGAGAIGRNSLQPADASGSETDLGGSFQIRVSPGDVLTIETPGGGGCGAPDDVSA